MIHPLEIHRQILKMVGEGASYWEPEFIPETVSAILYEMISCYRELLRNERIQRAMRNHRMPDLAERAALMLLVIRKLRPHLTPDLSAEEVAILHPRLLKMMLRCTEPDPVQVILARGEYERQIDSLLVTFQPSPERLHTDWNGSFNQVYLPILEPN